MWLLDIMFAIILVLVFLILHSPLWILMTIGNSIVLASNLWYFMSLQEELLKPEFIIKKSKTTILVNSILCVFWFLQDNTDLVIQPDYKGERLSGYYILFKIIVIDVPQNYLIKKYAQI